MIRLDNRINFLIIDPNNRYKDVDEDEYVLGWQPREQEAVKACLHSSTEWTSESQGEQNVPQ